MTKKTTRQIGNEGENRAVEFLVSRHFEILETNYRFRRNEVDIICLKDNLLVFVEVKYRKTNHFGEAEDFVTAAQLHRLHEAAEDYMLQINWQKEIRFDIIAIAGDQLEHFLDIS